MEKAETGMPIEVLECFLTMSEDAQEMILEMMREMLKEQEAG